jgi:hypothetical protein
VGKLQLQPTDFSKGLPVLTFSTGEQFITGTDGCGNVSGPIQLAGSRINFGTLKISGESCKNESVRNIFKSRLNNLTIDYFFKEGKLVLYLVDDSQLTLRRRN